MSRHKDYDDREAPLGAGTPRLAVRYSTRLEDLSELEVDEGVDLNSNELRDSGGDVCARCARQIHEGEFVRRRTDGSWQHESCPL